MEKNSSNLNQDTISYQEALKILTPKEITILEYVEKGYTNNEIANELYLSVRTIQTHRNNMCIKLNLKGRNSLLKWALIEKL